MTAQHTAIARSLLKKTHTLRCAYAHRSNVLKPVQIIQTVQAVQVVKKQALGPGIFPSSFQSEFFSNLQVSCLRSSFKNSKPWQWLKPHSNPPLSPFFKGGSFAPGLELLFGKDGKGRFLGGVRGNYVANFWVRTLVALMVLALAMGCDSLPGKPRIEERWKAATEVTDFSQLYAGNCSGCHGAAGRLGAARPLNDPLYLALASDDTLRQMIAQGVGGTSAPAFAQQAGGNLTDKQIDILVEGMRSRWGGSESFKNVALPPYGLQDAIAKGSGSGDLPRGAIVYQTYCAQCHGADGRGGSKGGSVIDPDYLALVSDQALRTAVIVGRSDLGMPDWRANIPGRPMSSQEIADVVAWLASHRQSELLSPVTRSMERR